MRSVSFGVVVAKGWTRQLCDCSSAFTQTLQPARANGGCAVLDITCEGLHSMRRAAGTAQHRADSTVFRSAIIINHSSHADSTRGSPGDGVFTHLSSAEVYRKLVHNDTKVVRGVEKKS